MESKKSCLCVGIDPDDFDLKEYYLNKFTDPRDLPKHKLAELCLLQYCVDLIDATHRYTAIYKPNSAFFEQYGAYGITTLQRVVEHAHMRGCLTILDFKRGDIGSTSEAYRVFAFEYIRADAITINAYMGREVIDAFKTDNKGIFVLTKTSNPGSSDFQTLNVKDGRPLYLYMAEILRDHSVGYVVGATDTEAISSIVKQEPTAWILCPGVGKQGAQVIDVINAVNEGSKGFKNVIMPISRGISRDKNWTEAAQYYAQLSLNLFH